MQTQEQILAELKTILVDLFEIEESKIVMEARLYEDLDLDSIDAVDMVVQLQKKVGKKVSPDDFKNVRTVADIVAAVEKILD